jgi:hypothetical protein
MYNRHQEQEDRQDQGVFNGPIQELREEAS